MKNLRIGIVGGGGMGRVHFANWQVVENASVAALCDTAPSAADTAAQWGVPLYRSITQMVQECDLDAVDICTPTFLHHDMVMESLNLGMDTICEKPIALHYADAKEMLDTAQAKGCHLYIAQILQFTKEIQALRQLVKSEEYGKVLDASFERLSAAPRWAVGGWLFDKSKSGLLPFDLRAEEFQSPAALALKLKDYHPRLIPYRAVGTASGLLLALPCTIEIGKQCKTGLVAFSPSPLSDGGGYEALTGGIHYA